MTYRYAVNHVGQDGHVITNEITATTPFRGEVDVPALARILRRDQGHRNARLLQVVSLNPGEPAMWIHSDQGWVRL